MAKPRQAAHPALIIGDHQFGAARLHDSGGLGFDRALAAMHRAGAGALAAIGQRGGPTIGLVAAFMGAGPGQRSPGNRQSCKGPPGMQRGGV